MSLFRQLFCSHKHLIRTNLSKSTHDIEWQCIACGKKQIKDASWHPVHYIHESSANGAWKNK